MDIVSLSLDKLVALEVTTSKGKQTRTVYTIVQYSELQCTAVKHTIVALSLCARLLSSLLCCGQNDMPRLFVTVQNTVFQLLLLLLLITVPY